METFYLALVIVLFFLAISDIIMGVSNDAVNFLNSALGSKTAKYKTIMIVAALGLVMGTLFSGGMMEVARKGIFHPQHFYFSEIIIIFLAVMVADIIILDIFNTYGMPTSTTISLVFELLGASVAISIFKIASDSNALQLSEYINTAKAFAIVSGIFVSVGIAFSSGVIVQFFSRMIFSFDYKRKLKYYGAVWGGLGLSAIVYFMLIKGIDGATFMTAENVSFIRDNSFKIIGATFIGAAILLQLVTLVSNFNILKFIVLVGTFALAMAFAGNDLVNFIGVSLAGFESFKLWRASGGISPDEMLMSGLAGKVHTPTFFLLTAGVIMVITLWTSKKAKTVVKTSLDLGRQDEGYERFEPNLASKMIVRSFSNTANFFERIIPKRLFNSLNSRFDQTAFITMQHENRDDAPSFDMIRASVTLIVASILISMGTTLKLPLSTTYVTFMVAMGASLADGAWGRESAVYRVSGVLSVIGGWFFTAFFAFTLTFIIASIFHFGGNFAIIPVLLIVGIVLYRTHILHKNRVEAQKANEHNDEEKLDKDNAVKLSGKRVKKVLTELSIVLNDSIIGLEKEDLSLLQKTLKKEKKANGRLNAAKTGYSKVISHLEESEIESGYYYIVVIDYLLEISHCVHNIIQPALSHVDNNHKPLLADQIRDLKELNDEIQKLIVLTTNVFMDLNGEDAKKIYGGLEPFFKLVKGHRKTQIRRIKALDLGSRNSNLFFNLTAEYRDIALFCNRLVQICDNLFINPSSDEG